MLASDMMVAFGNVAFVGVGVTTGMPLVAKFTRCVIKPDACDAVGVLLEFDRNARVGTTAREAANRVTVVCIFLEKRVTKIE